jgi:replicative DNA helicase
MTAQPYLPTQNVPFSQEAEEAVIGAIIVNPSTFERVSAYLKADDFFLLRHNYIWQAFERLQGAGVEIDYITVTDNLRNFGHLEGVGGETYIIGMFRNTPTSVHAEAYGRIVQRAAVRRRLMAAADEIRGLALNENMAIEEVITNAEARLDIVSQQAVTDQSTTDMRQASNRLYDMVETRMGDSEHPLLGVPTGFSDLDYLLDGFTAGFHVLAGRPAMGKTALQLCFMMAAAKAGVPSFLASMEMDELEILIRLYSMETGINSRELRRGKLDTPQWTEFVNSVGRIGGLPIFIDDSNSLSPRQLRTKVLQAQRKFRTKFGVVFVDGIYKMRAGVVLKEEGMKVTDRRVETGYICSALKNMSRRRDLGIPIVATHQLSRAVEQRQDKRPMLSDLRESGDVEQEADSVMFIYRDAYYNEASEFPNQADIIVAKQRAGATGTVSLYFDKSITKFQNAATRNIDFTTMTVTNNRNGYHNRDDED